MTKITAQPNLYQFARLITETAFNVDRNPQSPSVIAWDNYTIQFTVIRAIDCTIDQTPVLCIDPWMFKDFIADGNEDGLYYHLIDNQTLFNRSLALLYPMTPISKKLDDMGIIRYNNGQILSENERALMVFSMYEASIKSYNEMSSTLYQFKVLLEKAITAANK